MMKSSIAVLAQVFKCVPLQSVISTVVAKHRADKKSRFIEPRRFDYRDQFVGLLLGQMSREGCLNGICIASDVHQNELKRSLGLSPFKLNTFSNANRTRNPKIAEDVFWGVMEELKRITPRMFRQRHKGNLSKFKNRDITAIDSTTIQLFLDSLDWALYRHRKAAFKAHMRVDIASFMPQFIDLTDGKTNDSKMAGILCEGLPPGSIAIADRGYNDAKFFNTLNKAGICFVVREKEKAKYEVVEKLPVKHSNVISDETIRLSGIMTSKKYEGNLRRIEADVRVNGATRRMVFLSNNFKWSAKTVADLYKARWTVELFFKEIKQTLQLKSFYGENENAVKWQFWTAMLSHLLMRYLKFVTAWKSSYTRLVGIVRTALWNFIDIVAYLKSYWIADGRKTPHTETIIQYLQGFAPL